MANLTSVHTGAAERGGLLGRVSSISTFQALANRPFRTLWYGMIASYMAMQMSLIARGYLAFHLSGSATQLGLVAGARALPQLLLSPFGGVAADRVDKRKLLVATQIATSAIGVVTALLVVAGIVAIWQLIVLGLLEGAV